jgi:acyl-coenzyme A thioesterase PaaI-like protein
MFCVKQKLFLSNFALFAVADVVPGFFFIDSAIYFGPNLEGPPHSAHGGAIATVLDQVVGNIAIAVLGRSEVSCAFAFPKSPNSQRPRLGFCVTGSLTVNYHAPVPLKGVYYCEAWIDRVEGKKRFVKAVLKENRESKKIYSSAEAVMVHIDISKFKNDNAPENKAKL